jgi:hypothetical protein
VTTGKFLPSSITKSMVLIQALPFPKGQTNLPMKFKIFQSWDGGRIESRRLTPPTGDIQIFEYSFSAIFFAYFYLLFISLLFLGACG